jgi:hypothetical protein
MKPPIESHSPAHAMPTHIVEATRLFARLTLGTRLAYKRVGTIRATREQILQQAATTIMTQANGQATAMAMLLR